MFSDPLHNLLYLWAFSDINPPLIAALEHDFGHFQKLSHNVPSPTPDTLCRTCNYNLTGGTVTHYSIFVIQKSLNDFRRYICPSTVPFWYISMPKRPEPDEINLPPRSLSCQPDFDARIHFCDMLSKALHFDSTPWERSCAALLHQSKIDFTSSTAA